MKMPQQNSKTLLTIVVTAATIIVFVWAMLILSVFNKTLAAAMRPAYQNILVVYVCIMLIAWFHATRFRLIQFPFWKSWAVALLIYGVIAIVTTLLQVKYRFWTLQLVIMAPGQILFFMWVLPTLLNVKELDTLLTGLTLCFGAFLATMILINALGMDAIFGIKLSLINKNYLIPYGFVPTRNSNTYCYQWLPAISLYLAMRRPSRSWRLIFGVIGILAIFLIAQAHSRSNQLALFISLSPLLIPLVGKYKKAFLWSGVFLVLSLCWVVYQGDVGYLNTRSVEGRGRIWLDILEHLSEVRGWLFGVGIYGYWSKVPAHNPHSSYIGHILYYGVIATAAWLYIIYQSMRYTWRALLPVETQRSTQLLMAIVIGIFVQGTMEDIHSYGFHFPGMMSYLILGVLMRHTHESENLPAHTT